MKIKYFIGFVVVSLALIGSLAWAQAQNIQYPIKELGSCENKSACKSYCDKSENTEACVNFAEKNNLMSKEEVEMSKKFMAAGSKGPGGCAGKDECNNFCNNVANIDECVAYAEKNNLMSPGELEEAKKVQAAIKRGVKPPPCGNKKQCDIYCEESEHMEECVAFGIEAGFIQGKELEDSQKMLAAIKKGAKPPPCKGKEACDVYCSSPDNIEACMTFAKAAGFMTPEEEQNSEKMISAIKKGVKPPQCKGKEACDAYCSEDSHIDECINFSIAAGFMNEKDAEMAKRTKGKGPGSCKGKDECEAFCNNPDNQETCFNFGKENGLIPEEDLKRMEEGKQKFQDSLQQVPPTVMDCLNSEVGTGLMEKFKSGGAMPPKDIGDKMKTCYEKTRPSGSEGQGEPGAGGDIPPAGQVNPDQKFQPGPGTTNPGGQMMPQQAGPGGCKGPEKCKVYCESNPDKCKGPGDNNQQPNMPSQPQKNREGIIPPSVEGMGPGTMQPPEGEQFQQPQNFQPPMEQTAPIDQQSPMNNIAPPPTEAPAPSPSSSFAPEAALGSLLNVFLFGFKR